MSNQKYISDSLRQKKQKIKKLKIYVLIFLILAIISFFIYLTRLPQIQVQEIQVSGNIFVEKSEIEQKVQEILHKKILYVIPRSNIFLFPKKQLEQSILQNPAIISAKIRRDFWYTLTIEIVEQEKEMMYCASLEKNNCFYINAKGFIYAEAKDLIIPEQEVIIYNENGIKRVGDIILNEQQYTNVLLFVKNTARYEIYIKEIYLKQDGIIEFVTREQTRMITSVFDDFKKGFANLIALFEKEIFKKETFSQVEYIDLRFGNKLFYKNKTN